MTVVSAELHSSPQDVPKSKHVEDLYQAYLKSGGILEIGLFHTVKNQAEVPGIETLSPWTQTQARKMAETAGLELLPQTLAYYGILCKNRIKVPAGTSDQGLLAQALLLNGELESYQRFISAFPNIFAH